MDRQTRPTHRRYAKRDGRLQVGGQESGQGLIRVAYTIVAAAWVIVVPVAMGQHVAGDANQRDRELRKSWNAVVNRVLEGDPWNEIGDELEAALELAGTTEMSPAVTDALAGIRAAELREPTLSANSMEAAPQALSELLISSRVINVAQRFDTRIITLPLIVTNATNDLLWSSYAVQPEHKTTDPAYRLYKRGWLAVPALLEALDDMTATRSAEKPRAVNRWAKLFRRNDLAMALLEAITRCRFYLAPRGVKWFSDMEGSDRLAAVESARAWWVATKEMPHAEARAWLISRIDHRRALQMANLAVRTEGEKAAGMRCLRSLLVDESKDELRLSVVRQLARFGDLTGIKALGERVNEADHKIADAELKIIIEYGGRREYAVLRRILTAKPSGKPNPNVNRTILRELARTKNSLAIPVYVAALFEANELPVSDARKAQRAPDWSQANVAMENIQRLSGRDFRFDPRAPAKSRLKAIERVRVWWETEGRGLYGLQGTRRHRGDGIR